MSEAVAKSQPGTRTEAGVGAGIAANQPAAGLPVETQGLLFGFLGVLTFSFTLPMTRAAVPELGGTFVGLGRALVAAALAAIVLLATRQRLPDRRHWPGLAIVAFGVVIGFPLCTSIALEWVPATHGAVVVGLMPALTAVMAVVRAGERPPPTFWLACAVGVITVLIFAITQGAGSLHPADILLLAGVTLGALGYAEGGRLSRELGGWRVICWSLLVAAPFLVVPVAVSAAGGVSASPGAWLGFAYVAVFSMFLGFFAWYKGLAIGGVARVSQLQLLQPVLTLLWAALLLGEPVSGATILASLLVIASVALTRLSWRATPAKR